MDCNAVAADQGGNVYIAGYFTDSIAIGSVSVKSRGGKDIFIAKYRSDGILAWLRTEGTIYDDAVERGLAVDSKHNVVMAGSFGAQVGTSGPQASIIVGTDSLQSRGSEDVIIIKYDSSGSPLWAKAAGSTGDERATNLTLDPADNIVVTGYFSFTVYFDTLRINSVSQGFAVGDIFVAKYNSAGSLNWAKAIGCRASAGGGYGGSGAGIATVSAITSDSVGNVMVGGLYENSDVIVGNRVIRPVSEFGSDMWLAKYTATGGFIWGKGAGSSEDDELGDIISSRGGFYVTGGCSNACAFDNDTLYYPPGSTAYRQLFLAFYDDGGQIKWSKAVGITAFTWGQAFAIGTSGDVAMCGNLSGVSAGLGSSVVTN